MNAPSGSRSELMLSASGGPAVGGVAQIAAMAFGNPIVETLLPSLELSATRSAWPGERSRMFRTIRRRESEGSNISDRKPVDVELPATHDCSQAKIVAIPSADIWPDVAGCAD
jgi:hypothetical protein